MLFVITLLLLLTEAKSGQIDISFDIDNSIISIPACPMGIVGINSLYIDNSCITEMNIYLNKSKPETFVGSGIMKTWFLASTSVNQSVDLTFSTQNVSGCHTHIILQTECRIPGYVHWTTSDESLYSCTSLRTVQCMTADYKKVEANIECAKLSPKPNEFMLKPIEDCIPVQGEFAWMNTPYNIMDGAAYAPNICVHSITNRAVDPRYCEALHLTINSLPIVCADTTNLHFMYDEWSTCIDSIRYRNVSCVGAESYCIFANELCAVPQEPITDSCDDPHHVKDIWPYVSVAVILLEFVMIVVILLWKKLRPQRPQKQDDYHIMT